MTCANWWYDNSIFLGPETPILTQRLNDSIACWQSNNATIQIRWNDLMIHLFTDSITTWVHDSNERQIRYKGVEV